MTLGAQVQLGRKPALAATKGFPCLSLFRRRPIAASPGGVLMRTNDGGIHEVEVPVDLAALMRFGLQIRQNAAWFKKCRFQVTPEIDRTLMVKGFSALSVTLI